MVPDHYPQVELLKDIDPRHIDQDIPQQLPENLKDPRDENAQNVVASTPNSVPPEPASQRMPTQPSMGISRQEADDTLALIQSAIRRLLARKPTPQSLSPIMQGFDIIRDEIDEYNDDFNRETMPPPSNSPAAKESSRKNTAARGKQLYRCRECQMQGTNKAVLRRHVETMHYPRWEFHCHYEDEGCDTFSKKHPRRKDKMLTHYRVCHKQEPPEDLRMFLSPCPPICVLCTGTVQDWRAFYECFLSHCMVVTVSSSNAGSSRQDRHGRGGSKRPRDDNDSFNRGAGNGGSGNGGPPLSNQGYGSSGNVNGGGHYHSFSGISGNQLSNGDSKPMLRARSASDSCDGRTKRSRPHQANDVPPPTSESKTSGSSNDQSGRSKKKTTRPPLNLGSLQGQAGSQSSVNNCKTCSHFFNTCPTCRDSPPSTDRCHACPPLERTQALQASNPHADLALRQSLTGQNMAFAGHPQFNPQDIHAGPNIPTTVNPELLAMEQYHWQINQARQRHAPAQGLIPRTSNQQRAFGGNQPYMAGAVHDVQVRGMSELDMESSILDSKAKWNSKKTQGSSTWSVILPFRSSPPPPRGSQLHLSGSQLPRPGSPLPLCKPLTGTGSVSVGGKQSPLSVPFSCFTSYLPRYLTIDPLTSIGMEIITREFIGPLSLKGPSSGCRCPCRTKPPAMYFTRGRVHIAPGRKIEVDLTMAQEAHDTGTRGMGHPLRTRIQLVVKIFRLRTAAKSASDKHKKEVCAAFKGAPEATVYDGDAATTTDQEDVMLVSDNSGYDWEVESVAECTTTVYTQASTCTDITVPSAPNSPRPPSLIFSETSSCTDLTSSSSRPSSPGFSGYSPKSSCADPKLPATARSRSPLRWSLDDDTLSNEELPIPDVGIFEKEGEGKDMEPVLGSGLKSSLDKLSRGRGGVPADEIRSGVASAWDYDRVSQYLMGQSLSDIFSRASRGNGFNPSWDKKPSS